MDNALALTSDHGILNIRGWKSSVIFFSIKQIKHHLKISNIGKSDSMLIIPLY
jgi:hypothetical protein